MRHHGGQSMVAPLRRVLVRRPDAALARADPRRWHYSAAVDLTAAQREHDALVALLEANDVEIVVHDAPCASADAIFTQDPCLITDAGAVLLRMGKALRADEPAALAATLARVGIPLIGALPEGSHAEGGDLLWLDSRTLAVGLGPRTDAAGCAALERLLRPQGIAVLPVTLPPPEDPAACLHLTSSISLLDRDLALTFSPGLPAAFQDQLDRRGFARVEVPPEEISTLGANALALAPRHVILLRGNPRTRRRLKAAGCRVNEYRGDEISLKTEGGPTCLTRPLWRDDGDGVSPSR